ncbi:YcgN family cysteine cluster protein [Marinobacterium sp. YM272]|uniref:YcgN family cysteine cluster protein n=1 Tax=Marinobacterium sp. YM272 TaxID=3421654 RepID=UPI003D7F53A8
MVAQEVFWRRKTLREMTREEWESLCDGCAICCLHKIEDEDTNEIFYTSVVCHLLDTKECRCTEYDRRTELVPTCIRMTPNDVEQLGWLPPTCAYRLLNEGKELPEWHPLVTGERRSPITAGASVIDIYDITDEGIDDDDLLDYVIEPDE